MYTHWTIKPETEGKHNHTISINIHSASISFSIAISICLVRVVIVGTIITVVTNIIPIIVILLWIVNEWAVVLWKKEYQEATLERCTLILINNVLYRFTRIKTWLEHRLCTDYNQQHRL